jgi:hypothetical protein
MARDFIGGTELTRFTLAWEAAITLPATTAATVPGTRSRLAFFRAFCLFRGSQDCTGTD